MDSRIFDNATKVLGSAITRRTGILAAVVGLVTASGTALEGDAARKATRRHEKLACRNANSQCLSDDECCSGRCVPKFGGTEFRCAKGRSRKKDGGKKGGSDPSGNLIPNGEPCTSADTCEDSNASCTTYVDNTPSGTYCLLQEGDTCDVGNVCKGHLCSDCSRCICTGNVSQIGTFGTEGSALDQFNNITGMAMTSDGLQMLVVDWHNNRVDVWVRSADCSLTWLASRDFSACGAGSLSGPWGIALSEDGLTAYVGDRGNNRICIYRRTSGTTDWSPIAEFGSAGTNPGEFSDIMAVAISPDGLTLAVSQTTVSNIAIFSRPNTSTEVWTSAGFLGSSGINDDQFLEPWGLNFSADGLLLYIADDLGNRISVWSRTSTETYVFTNDYVWTSNPGGFNAGDINQPSSVNILDGGLTMVVGNFNIRPINTYTRPDTSSTSWTFQSAVNANTQKSLVLDGPYTYSGDLFQVVVLGPTCSD